MIDWYEAYIVVFYDYIHRMLLSIQSTYICAYKRITMIYNKWMKNFLCKWFSFFWSNLIQISQHMWIKKSFHVEYTSSKVHSHFCSESFLQDTVGKEKRNRRWISCLKVSWWYWNGSRECGFWFFYEDFKWMYFREPKLIWNKIQGNF